MVIRGLQLLKRRVLGLSVGVAILVPEGVNWSGKAINARLVFYRYLGSFSRARILEIEKDICQAFR